MHFIINEWTQQITAEPNITEQDEIFRIYRHLLYYGGPVIIDKTKFTTDNIEYFPAYALKFME